MEVTVITPAIPERANLLAEAIASVARQTLAPAAHLVGVDFARIGPAAIRNRLASGATTEWLAFLDDDDLLDPHHLQTLAAGAREGADVAYTWCRVEGGDGWNPNSHFDGARLEGENFIPVTAAIRTSLFHQVGGFPDGPVYEDWELWRVAYRAGARFVCIPEVTWSYRLLNGNRPGR